jgi:hypothetical protein
MSVMSSINTVAIARADMSGARRDMSIEVGLLRETFRGTIAARLKSLIDDKAVFRVVDCQCENLLPR